MNFTSEKVYNTNNKESSFLDNIDDFELDIF